MAPGFLIDRVKSEDLDEALCLVKKVFLEYEAPDYSEEGVEEFMKFIEYDSIKEKLEQEQFFMWTCIAEGKVIGVLATRPPCHISLLFVERKYQRIGIARTMLYEALYFYKTHYNFKEITVNSSPYAIPIYHKWGFTDTDVEQTINGIRFVPMRRKL